MRSLILVLPAALLALVPLACGSDQKNVNEPGQMGYQQPGYQQPGYQQPGYQQPGYQQPGQPGYQQPGAQPGYQQPGTYPQPTATGYPPPGATATAPPPTGTQPTGTTPAPAGGAAQPIDPTMAGMLTPVLTQVAGSEVKGMQPEGKAFAANFQPGQTLEQPFTLNPGKCYSVVGVGMGIQQMDITIVTQPVPQLPPQVLAQSNTQGPNATLGGKGACYKNPTPFAAPAKVVVKATQGQGMGLAQIYVK